jgi:hypothetical protein
MHVAAHQRKWYAQCHSTSLALASRARLLGPCVSNSSYRQGSLTRSFENDDIACHDALVLQRLRPQQMGRRTSRDSSAYRLPTMTIWFGNIGWWPDNRTWQF